MGLSLSGGGGGGKLRWWWVGVIALVLVVSVAAIAWQLAPREDPTVVKVPDEYHFRCTRCGRAWTTDARGAIEVFGGQPTTMRPANCPHCGEKRCAYLLARCPWCGGHYIHPHLLTDPDKRPSSESCPHCGKDTMKWRK